MPFGNREAFQLGLILLCVPVQHFLVMHFDGPAAGRSQIIFEVYHSVQKVKDSLFSLEAWKQRWIGIVSSLVGLYFPEAGMENSEEILFVEPETCPPLDVIRYRKKEGYFGSSTEVRERRSTNVRYRIGQVVYHRLRGYRAIVVGWDLIAKAPDKWIENKYGPDKHLKNVPHYILLVDERDLDLLNDDDFIEFSVAPETYVIQGELTILRDTVIQSPEIKKRFHHFDGAQYIPGPTLRAMYPMD